MFHRLCSWRQLSKGEGQTTSTALGGPSWEQEVSPKGRGARQNPLPTLRAQIPKPGLGRVFCVVEDEDLLWKVDDKVRGLSFKATNCLRITESEMDFFLSLTQGVSTARIIGRTPPGMPESYTVTVLN